MFPLSCIYTGYTPQHGNSILYRDNTCCANELVYPKFPSLSDSLAPGYPLYYCDILDMYDIGIRYGTTEQLNERRPWLEPQKQSLQANWPTRKTHQLQAAQKKQLPQRLP